MRLPPARPLARRLHLALGDVRDVLCARGSPAARCRVVLANNFGGVWADTERMAKGAVSFQTQLVRLLARALRPGTLLVSASRLSESRTRQRARAPMAAFATAAGGAAAQPTSSSSASSSSSSSSPTAAAAPLPVLVDSMVLERPDAYFTTQLFFEVCGGWREDAGDNWARLDAPARRALLLDDAFDEEVEACWQRGRARPEYAALAALLGRREQLLVSMRDARQSARGSRADAEA